MTKMIYNVMAQDKAMNEWGSLVAFAEEDTAKTWREDYIRENYGSELDMNHEGVHIFIEVTPFENK